MVDSVHIWLWVTIDPKNKEILALTISKERNTLIAERFLSRIVNDYGKHPVFTDGSTYTQDCQFLKLNHHIYSPLEKSLIERTIPYIKDRTEYFNNYFHGKVKNCKMKHVLNWLKLVESIYILT